MILTNKRKLILIGSALVLSIYGITLISRMSQRQAAGSARHARMLTMTKDAEIARSAHEQWRVDQQAHKMTYEADKGASFAMERSESERMKPQASPSPSAQFSPSPSGQSAQSSRQRPEAAASRSILPAPADRLVSSQKIVRTGQLSLEVKTFSSAFNRVQDIVAEVGGTISNIQVRRPEKNSAQGTVTLRVPPTEYFRALNMLRPLGTLENESSTIQDVTRQWLNLDVRIQHKREIENRMWGAVRNSSNDLNWLSEAENNLDGVNEGIEQLESERYNLQQDVLFSTITLELHEPVLAIPAPATPSMWAPLGQALNDASIQVVMDVSRLIYLGLVLLPWALLGWSIWRPVWRLVRRFKEAQQERRLDTVL